LVTPSPSGDAFDFSSGGGGGFSFDFSAGADLTAAAAPYNPPSASPTLLLSPVSPPALPPALVRVASSGTSVVMPAAAAPATIIAAGGAVTPVITCSLCGWDFPAADIGAHAAECFTSGHRSGAALPPAASAARSRSSSLVSAVGNALRRVSRGAEASGTGELPLAPAAARSSGTAGGGSKIGGGLLSAFRGSSSRSRSNSGSEIVGQHYGAVVPADEGGNIGAGAEDAFQWGPPSTPAAAPALGGLFSPEPLARDPGAGGRIGSLSALSALITPGGGGTWK
jgi:hypothetical protein